MKKLMVLGAGIYQLPAIKTARDMGHHVIAVDNIPNNIGHKFSHISENISTVDKNVVLIAAVKYNIDGIMTIASDIAVPTVAYITSKLGLPGISEEQAHIISNKTHFRLFQKHNNFRHPEFCEVTLFSEAKNFFELVGPPLLIKPVDRSGSTGVSRIDTFNELSDSFELALNSSLKKSVIIERFLKGTEVGCELFCFDGVVKTIGVTNKYLTSDYVVKGHTLPSKLSSNTLGTINIELQRLVNALGIKNGPINTDIILTEDGPCIIDIGARLGGNCLPQIIQHSTGINTINLAINCALGYNLSRDVMTDHKPTGVRILGAPFKGIIESHTDLNYVLNEYPEIIELALDYKTGDEVFHFSQGKMRVGHIIANAGTLVELELLLESIEKSINLQYCQKIPKS